MIRYELKQGGRSLGVRSFAETKRFILRCAPPGMKARIVDAKQAVTLSKALGQWAELSKVGPQEITCVMMV